MKTGVYEIVNTANGKRYIGSTLNFAQRWPEHRKLLRRGKHHSVIFQNAWNKYGEASFVFKPLLFCSRENLIMYEQRFFDVFKPEYNRSLLAHCPPAGKRPEQSARQSGRKLPPEWCANIAKAKLGTKLGPQTPEHRAKISAAQAGRPHSPEHVAKTAAAKRGVKASAETCAKHAAAMLGNTYAKGAVHTAEMRAAKSARQLGKKLKLRTPEHAAKLTASRQRNSRALARV